MEKKVLFRTDDGFDIFEGDAFFEPDLDFCVQEWKAYARTWENNPEKRKKHFFFKLKENCQNYNRLNQPKFSETDFKIALRQHNIAEHFIEQIINFSNERLNADPSI